MLGDVWSLFFTDTHPHLSIHTHGHTRTHTHSYPVLLVVTIRSLSDSSELCDCFCSSGQQPGDSLFLIRLQTCDLCELFKVPNSTTSPRPSKMYLPYFGHLIFYGSVLYLHRGGYVFLPDCFCVCSLSLDGIVPNLLEGCGVGQGRHFELGPPDWI